MSDVVCLIADPARAPLEQAVVEAVADALGGAAPRWLADAEACELAVPAARGEGAFARARAAVGTRPVDVCLVPARERIKRLLVSDMDSTIITVECIDELADLAGVKAEVAAITRRAMNGELDFRAALEARVALLAGLPAGVLEEVYRGRVRLMAGARTLVRTMHARGAFTALVSGGFLPIVEWVRADVGFDLAAGNRLEVQGGRLTGRVVEPVHCPQTKVAILERLRRARGLRRAQTLAIGDGANDLPMLAAAGLGVAFRGHPRVIAASPACIEFGDLTALLYLQGLPRRAFVVA